MKNFHDAILLGGASVLALALSFGSAEAGQSDIDLFTGSGSFPPNIMIMLDSSRSMRDLPSSGGTDSKNTIAKNALNTLITSVNPPDGSGGYTENARFGLFIFQSKGGRLVSPISSGNTATVLADIASQTAPAFSTPIDGAVLDVARYFNGATEPWGTLENWGRDSTEPTVADPFDYSCRTSHLIYMTDGAPTSDDLEHPGFWATIGDADGDAGAGEAGLVEDGSDVTNPLHEWGDDITYAMYHRDFRSGSSMPGLQNITTHTIGFDVNLPLLQRMATNGGGLYKTANNASTLATALQSATQAVVDASASYSTAVVPSSRTQFGSAFYNAYFEPDANDPFWEGHLEAYGILSDGTIVDKFGSPAVDPSTNLLYDPHQPNWDAGVVMRGQTASRRIYTYKNNQRIPFSLANVGVGATQIGVADMNILPGEIGFYPNAASSGIATTTALRDAIIGYLHGQDGFNENNDSSWTEPRAKVLGDIFHSTPRIIGAPSTNLMAEDGFKDYYDAYYDRQRLIYFGANDGMLHAIDAGTFTVGDDPSTTAVETVYYTTGTGAEVFGYVPGLLLGEVKRVPLNNPRTYYFVDGSPVAADVWIPSSASDVSKEDTEWMTTMITGFREGGAGYFAMDITDPAAVALPHGPYPRVMWEFTEPTLGQAWSEPIITRVKVNDGTTNDHCGPDDGDGDCREHWVAIMGGGYNVSADPNTASFESNPSNAGWSDRSKSMFMVDIATGNVLARVEFHAVFNPDMIYALPSKPAVIDYDFDGFADVVYIGDLGGQMWKWDIKDVGVDSDSDGEVDNWSAGVWFRTSPESIGGGNYHYRSFYYPPAATLTRGRLKLAFASGEREQLRYAGDASYTENNRFYVIDDIHPTGASAFSTIYSESDLTDVTNIHTNNDPSKDGYYFEVRDGEKFISDVLIFAGYVVAVSYAPTSASADPCLSATGESTLYVFDVATGGGYWQGSNPTPMPARQYGVGGGLATTPRISIAPDPNDDKIYIKTSKGMVLTLDPPPRKEAGNQIIYWKQNY